MDIGLLTAILTRLALGLGAGFTTGLTGMGTAIFIVPSLIALGIPAVNAVGTGAFYATLTRTFATHEHLRLRTVRKRTAFYIVLGGVPLAIVTSFFITRLAKTADSGIDSILKVVIGVVMLAMWILMSINLLRNRKGGPKDYYVPPKHFPFRRKLYGIAAGAGVGILVGSTAIGGGVLTIPILVTVFGLSPNNAVGTSMMVSVVMSAATAIAYLLGAKVNVAFALTMFVGTLPGVFLGCRLSVKVPHKVLEGILLSVITISVILMATRV